MIALPEVFVVKVVIIHEVDVVARVDKDDISREIALTQSDMLSVLLQIAVVESDISFLDIVISFIQSY